MAKKLNFVGVPVYMNGRNYYIPSLSKRQYQENAERLASPIPEGTPDAQVLSRFDDIILMAIQRNYPDVTAAELDEWLDLNTTRLAIQALTGASGLETVSGTVEGE
jgi:hypothetical protein